MRGIVRPCRHSLGSELHAQWESHLCGLCLTLRDQWGQAARMLTGYDLLILSVLVEAQTGRVATVEAGRCPLRGMRTADVVPSSDPGARLAATASLLSGAATIEDKVRDGDLPRWSTPVGIRVSKHAAARSRQAAEECGINPDLLSQAAARAARAERRGGDLPELLAPTGEAVAELFARTAIVAGVPANAAHLARSGDAFGRLVHLIDAVEDLEEDARRGSFNPIEASATSIDDAREMAIGLTETVRAGLDDTVLAEPELARQLLGPVLERSVKHAFAPRVGSLALAAATIPLISLGIFRRRKNGFASDNEIRARKCGRCACACCEMEACTCCAEQCGI